MREYEIVEHASLEDLNVFLVEMTYRCSHVHKEFELLVVLAGTIVILYGQRQREFHKTDVIIINPRQPHEIHALTENAIILSVQAAASFCRKIYPELCNVEFDKNYLEDIHSSGWEKSVYDRLFELALNYFESREQYGFFCLSCLYEIFGLLLKHHPWHCISEQEKSKRYCKGKRLERITDYIDCHYTEKLLLEEVALREGISVSYASHFLKDNLGISFQEYLTLLRFEKARRLVEQTGRNITEISLECGFSDCRYLNGIYQKQLGYTPMEYRRAHDTPVQKGSTGRQVNTQRIISKSDSIQLLQLIMKRRD
ncbi:AraC family transcriptional regulator [Diplocloster modestus]|uniref:AraC family transcriptional regulator n=1 Tax=Diplocloster modestus TaxID=2850322 RepID=A0ABS6K6R3_9FIRM|nr:AraC family transcriptional regulator [Diplocloster modestus]MBU9726199.1 AraC family transcriptional regulator [Diplocloster modestus]